jgi:hypothetical protein
VSHSTCTTSKNFCTLHSQNGDCTHAIRDCTVHVRHFDQKQKCVASKTILYLFTSLITALHRWHLFETMYMPEPTIHYNQQHLDLIILLNSHLHNQSCAHHHPPQAHQGACSDYYPCSWHHMCQSHLLPQWMQP